MIVGDAGEAFDSCPYLLTNVTLYEYSPADGKTESAGPSATVGAPVSRDVNMSQRTLEMTVAAAPEFTRKRRAFRAVATGAPTVADGDEKSNVRKFQPSTRTPMFLSNL